MHILHVTPYYPPTWSYGGIPRIVSGLAQQQVQDGHQVSVLSTDVYDETTRYTGPSIGDCNGVTVLRATNVSNRLAYRQLFLPLQVKRLLHTLNNVDIIHLHGHRHLLNNQAMRFAQSLKLPTVFTANGTLRRIESKQGIKWMWDQLFSGWIPKSVTACIAVSPADIAIHRANGIQSERIHYIPNGLDLKEFDPLPLHNQFRNSHGLPNEAIITYLGRISQRKGVSVLINAFKKINHPCQLVIAGNDMGGLEEAKKTADGHLNIHFVGTLKGEERLALLRDTDVLVYPSKNEIFGLVPFEGLLCGAPVVVSDDCGCGQIIQEAQAGLLAPYGDIDSLSQRLELLLSDRQMAQTMVTRGKRYIKEQLDFEVITEQHLKLYQMLIEKTKDTPNANRP